MAACIYPMQSPGDDLLFKKKYRMKLSVTHLRLLQEARERTQVSCVETSLLGLPFLLEYYVVAHDFFWPFLE